MRLILLFFLLAFYTGASAQLLDSIGQFLKEERKFLAKLDMRGSFIRNEQVQIYGAKIGFEHAERFQYGIGYSMLFTPIEGIRFVTGVGELRTRLRMGYVNPYVDYAFFQRGPWEIRIMAQLGFGRGTLSYATDTDRKIVLKRSGLILYEPAMTVQYRFWKYLGLGAGWGFRLAIQTNNGLGENLNAPIYTFGLKVFFGDIWRDLRPELDGK